MSFTESILNAGDFGPGDTEWIHLIIGEWQIIADVAHSDLVLWFPTDYVVADGSVPDSVTVAYPIVCRARRSPVISLLSRT